jgi:hypothetical protein
MIAKIYRPVRACRRTTSILWEISRIIVKEHSLELFARDQKDAGEFQGCPELYGSIYTFNLSGDEFQNGK